MKMNCTVCGKVGILQQRGKSCRMQHYIGFENGKRIYEYHKVGSKLEVNLMEVKNPDLSRKAKTMAGGEGFEPSTPNLGGWCSIREDTKTLREPPFVEMSPIRTELLAHNINQNNNLDINTLLR